MDASSGKSPPPSPLGSLVKLPRELRDRIYQYLLVGSNDRGWGWHSGISMSLLRTSRTVHDETANFLFKSKLVVPVSPHIDTNYIPTYALARMIHPKVATKFWMANRGDTELDILYGVDLKRSTDHVALSLRRSRCLQTLEIGLLNEAQRKRGPKLLRNEAVMNQVRSVLRPFAVLPRQVQIEISGFDTLDYAEIFDEMRRELADSDMSVEELCELDPLIWMRPRVSG